MSNTKIVLNRQSDLILDNANITAPVGIVVADIAGLESALLSIDTKESADLSAEASSRVSGDASIAAGLSTELVDRAAAVSSEESARISGDASLAADLDDSTIIRNQMIFAEESSRIAGDASLAADLSTEASNRVDGDVSVTAAMSAEISTRIVAETSLQNNISAEESSRIVGDQAEESRAIAAETSLATDLDAEQSRAESAEASLNAKVENVISNVDPAALDSLTEIVGAFQSADGDLNGAITALSSTATAAVDNEASIRLSADQSLAGDLSSEIADREAAVSLEEAARISGDASVHADLSAEVEARISDVNAEQARAESAEGVLTAGLSTELVARAAAISSEASTRLAADNSIAAGLSSELIARASADTAEASTRLAADNSIAAGLSSELVARASAITSEASSRVAGDASLAAEITALPETDGTTIIIDATTNTIQLKEAVAAPTSGTRTFSGLINVAAQPASLAGFGDLTLVTKSYVSGQVSTEASTRLAADNSIAAGLSSELVARASADTAEASTRLAADNSIAAGLSSELVDRAAAVSAEASTRLAADTSLSSALTDEIEARIADVNAEESSRIVAVSAEASSRVAGDLSLQNQIDFITSNVDPAALDSLTEIVSAFQSADGDINNAITNLASAAGASLSTEISDRIVAIDNEASIRLAADVSIQTAVGYNDGGTDFQANWSQYEGLFTADFQALADEQYAIASFIANRDGNVSTGSLPASDPDYFSPNNFPNIQLHLSSDSVQAVMNYVNGGQNVWNFLQGEISNGAPQGDIDMLQAMFNTGGQYQYFNILSGIQDVADLVNTTPYGGAMGYLDLSGVAGGDVNTVLPAIANIIDNLRISFNSTGDSYIYQASVRDMFSPKNLTNFEAWRDSSLGTAITDEVNARQSADQSLATQISNSITSSVDNEASIRLAADQSLAADLSSEISRAESVEDTKLDLAGGTMSGGIDMNGNNIGGLNEIYTNYIETDRVHSKLGGDITIESNLDFANTISIINLSAPTADGDAANKLYVDSADQSLATALSSEISRAEAAEGSLEIALSSEVSYLLANTDLTSIDSFAEVSDALAAQVSDFTAIYFKKASFSGSINGTNADFTLADAVRSGSETVYLNGLLQEAGVEYTVAGNVITFATSPSNGDKVVIYGVY